MDIHTVQLKMSIGCLQTTTSNGYLWNAIESGMDFGPNRLICEVLASNSHWVYAQLHIPTMCIEIADACRDANFNLRIYVPRGARALEGPIVTKGIHCKSMFVPPTQGLQRDYHFTPAMLPLCPPPLVEQIWNHYSSEIEHPDSQRKHKCHKRSRAHT